MDKKIVFASLYPEHLNLNGDASNLLVLQKRLQWRGIAAEIVEVKDPQDLTHFDFIMVGHGSESAWLQVLERDPNLLRVLAKLVKGGKPMLAVASGYEKLMHEIDSSFIKRSTWVSKFVNFEGNVGYINSDLDVAPVFDYHGTLFTLFHGPVLAKNPGLADHIISKAGWADISLEGTHIEEVDSLAQASRTTAFED